MQQCQYAVTGGFHQGHSTGELLAQHLGDLLPMGAHLIRLLDHEYCLWPPAGFVYMAAATMSWAPELHHSTRRCYHKPREKEP